MRARTLFVFLLLAGLALIVPACRQNQADSEKLAVANAFGQFTGFLLSTNYAGAYEMMSSDFKGSRSLTAFQEKDEHKALTKIFTNCNWNAGAAVYVVGDEAELRIKYNGSFGRSYSFRKEGGHWRYTDRTSDFEASSP